MVKREDEEEREGGMKEGGEERWDVLQCSMFTPNGHMHSHGVFIRRF
jgi:hypothetical protein